MDVTTDRTPFLTEPAERYHSLRGQYLTSHLLASFRKSPLLYYREVNRLVEREDTPAYAFGRAVHTLVLEGPQAYQREYVVGGPVNAKTGKPYGKRTKAFEAWAADQTKPALSRDDSTLAWAMCDAVHKHPAASMLLDGGIPEAVVRCQMNGLRCQARLDWIAAYEGGGIVDLKTCDDLSWFEADVRRYGYHYQMAFYRSAVAGVVDDPVEDIPVHLIGVEKQEPYRVGVWKLSDGLLADAQRENFEAMRRLTACLEHNDWPTGYEDVRLLDAI